MYMVWRAPQQLRVPVYIRVHEHAHMHIGWHRNVYMVLQPKLYAHYVYIRKALFKEGLQKTELAICVHHCIAYMYHMSEQYVYPLSLPSGERTDHTKGAIKQATCKAFRTSLPEWLTLMQVSTFEQKFHAWSCFHDSRLLLIYMWSSCLSNPCHIW